MSSLQPFLALRDLVSRMLDAAQAADWEKFIVLQAEHQQLAAHLPVIDWHDFNHEEQRILIDCLQATRTMLNETVPLAEGWRNELAGKLSSIHNTSKLDKAYRA